MQASDSSTGCKIGLIGPLFRCLDYFIDLQTTENNKEKHQQRQVLTDETFKTNVGQFSTARVARPLILRITISGAFLALNWVLAQVWCRLICRQATKLRILSRFALASRNLESLAPRLLGKDSHSKPFQLLAGIRSVKVAPKMSQNLFKYNNPVNCPFHPSSLRHPTTLHALTSMGKLARRSRSQYFFLLTMTCQPDSLRTLRSVDDLKNTDPSSVVFRY